MTQHMREPMSEQTVNDLAAIRQAALDYMQGWYEGDAERMRRSLHPELAKRAILRDIQSGEQRFYSLSCEQMVEKTRQGGGTDTPSDKRYYDVSVLDVYGDIASVRANSYDYVDYLHLARSEGRWVIVNVLWASNSTKR
ncbi:MAG TPA: nuclear transport factor 2 family protein [Ktedonobacterales bacterium]|jgi:putative lumazine-binding protein|nr:nuclear transport factor 2 family protein [Ktedonobacterales bacterium]